MREGAQRPSEREYGGAGLRPALEFSRSPCGASSPGLEPSPGSDYEPDSPASLPVPHLFSGTTLSRPRPLPPPPPKKSPHPSLQKQRLQGQNIILFTHMVISFDLEILIKIKIDNAVNDVNTVESAAATP